MESLALLVAAIVLAIIALGVVSVVAVVRPPTSRLGAAVTLAINAVGVASGLWFALLDIGFGARIIGGCVVAACSLSALRLLKRRDT